MQKEMLLALARESIEYGQSALQPLPILLEDYDDSLRQEACCFVTLTKHNVLRGCIGALEPYQPLVKDVVEHAYAAAYRDPRFPKVSEEEIAELKISISVLTPHTQISCTNEDDLLGLLQPGVDGLILEERDAEGCILHKSTFLPSVWEQLPDKAKFLEALKQKAGLSSEYWSRQLCFYRYTTESFKEL